MDSNEPPSLKTEPRGWTGLLSSNFALVLALSAGLGFFLGVVNEHYAVRQWLAWHYLGVGALAALWALSCLSGGYALLSFVRGGTTPADAVIAFPLGVFAFQTAMFLLGLANVLGTAVFVLLPALFLLAGARPLRAALRSAVQTLRFPSTALDSLVVVFGVLSIAIVYFQILSPEAFSWDARWYHLPLGQQYALQGSVSRSPEAWWLAGYPHSASLVYAWAFLLPTGVLFDRLELCVHLEFAVFLATLASIPSLVRALVPGARGRGTWVAFFLFPAIFLYDGNLCAGADHVAALWCVPLVLSLIAVWNSWHWRDGLLFGAFVAAILATKFSAWSMLALPGVLFVARAAWLMLKKSRPVLPALAMTSVAVLVLSAQYWLRNWVWYSDPLFPVLHDFFHATPWSREASASYRLFKSFTFPPAPGVQGVKDALTNTLTFSFKPNDWASFHRDVPIFGSLFTLTMVCLPFARAGWRLWLGYLGSLAAIIAWYLTSHQDRYLQAWLPCMAACTAGVFTLIWNRKAWALRALVVLLIGAQVIWGADVPFFATHNVIYDSPLHTVSQLIASGFNQTKNRLRLYGDEGLVAERLPKGSTLLMHEINMQVGFASRTVSDQWQARLSYATLSSPRAIYDELKDLKVTHLGWTATTTGWNPVGADLAFMNFALNHARDKAGVGAYTLATLPNEAPTAPFNDRVAIHGCGTPYANGLYRVSSLIEPEPGNPWAAPEAPVPDFDAAAREAGFLVIDSNCAPQLSPETTAAFHPPVTRLRGTLKLYVRRY